MLISRMRTITTAIICACVCVTCYVSVVDGNIVDMVGMNLFTDDDLVTSYVSAEGKFGNGNDVSDGDNDDVRISLLVVPAIIGYQCSLPVSALPTGPNQPGFGTGLEIPVDNSTSDYAYKALLIQVEQLRDNCVMLNTVTAQAASLGYEYIMLWSNATYDVGANLVTTLLYSPHWAPPNGTIGFFDVTLNVGSYLNDIYISSLDGSSSTVDDPMVLIITLNSSPYQTRLLSNVRNSDSPIDARITVTVMASSCLMFCIIQTIVQLCQARYGQNPITTPGKVYIIYLLVSLVLIEIVVDAWLDPFGIIITTSVITTSIYCCMFTIQALCYVMTFYLLLSSITRHKHESYKVLMKLKIPVYTMISLSIILVPISKVIYYYTSVMIMTYIFLAMCYITLLLTNVVFIVHGFRAVNDNCNKDYKKLLLIYIVMLSCVLNYLPVIGMALQTPSIWSQASQMSTVVGQVFYYNYSRYSTIVSLFILTVIPAFCHWTQMLVFNNHTNRQPSELPLSIIDHHSHHSHDSKVKTNRQNQLSSSDNNDVMGMVERILGKNRYMLGVNTTISETVDDNNTSGYITTPTSAYTLTPTTPLHYPTTTTLLTTINSHDNNNGEIPIIANSS